MVIWVLFRLRFWMDLDTVANSSGVLLNHLGFFGHWGFVSVNIHWNINRFIQIIHGIGPATSNIWKSNESVSTRRNIWMEWIALFVLWVLLWSGGEIHLGVHMISEILNSLITSSRTVECSNPRKTDHTGEWTGYGHIDHTGRKALDMPASQKCRNCSHHMNGHGSKDLIVSWDFLPHAKQQ